MAAMGDAGIGTAKYYPVPMHEQPAMAAIEGWSAPTLPCAESCRDRTFALPAFPGITLEQQEEVAAVVTKTLA